MAPQPPRVPLVEGPMPSEERGKFVSSGLCVSMKRHENL